MRAQALIAEELFFQADLGGPRAKLEKINAGEKQTGCSAAQARQLVDLIVSDANLTSADSGGAKCASTALARSAPEPLRLTRSDGCNTTAE